jgi:hypothetical protein
MMISLPQPLRRTLTDIHVDLDADTVLLTLNRGRCIDRMKADMRSAVAMARSLIKPKAALVWVDVKHVAAETVILNSQITGERREVMLSIGPHADLMAAARIALISVGTIGDELDAAVQRLNKKGDVLGAYFLDSAGVVALSEVGRAVRELAEREAARRDWGVSPSLGPGTLAGWPLTGQRDLWGFLNSDHFAGAAAMGISLSQSGVLKPHKSATGLIGLGPDYRSRKVGSVCGFCQLRDTCWRRRKNASEAQPAAGER